MGLGHVVDGNVHPLEHRGQHGAGLQVVLVAIHPNGQFATILGSLVHTHAGATGGCENYVSAFGKLGFGQFTAACRVVPGSASGASHVAEDFGFGVAKLSALLVTTLELADQRYVHATYKTDLASLAGHGSHHAYQKAAFLFLEHHRLHIGQVHHHVDDGKVQFREVFGYLFNRRRLAEAHRDDGAGTFFGHAADRLLALGFIGNFELQVGLAGFFLPAFHAVVRGFIE